MVKYDEMNLERAVKPVKPSDRRVANIHTAEFTPWLADDGAPTGQSYLQLNSEPGGVGFHVFRMDPDTTTTPHQHTGDEEFYLLSGDLRDNDGTVYKEGDLVWMKEGTEHYSYSEHGCTLLVYIKTAEVNV